MSYRNASNKEEKRTMERLIQSIKTDFETEVAANDKRLVQLRKLNADLFNLTQQTSLFERTKKELAYWNKQVNEQTGKVNKLETELDEIKSNKIYENAFEWRFEFPEVLNDEGDYVGFDIVIGNPPYIPLEAIQNAEKNFFKNKYTQFERKYETSVMFMVDGFNLLNIHGFLAFIAPATWQTGENYSKFRHYLFENKGIVQIINLPFNTFEDAYIDTSVYIFYNKELPGYNIFNFDKKEIISELKCLHFEYINKDNIKTPDRKLLLNKTVGGLLNKFLTEKFIPLGVITKSTQGLSGSKFLHVEGDPSDEYTFPFLKNGNIYNYSLIKNEIILTTLNDKKSLVNFYKQEPKVLIRRIINRQDRLSVTYCEEKLVFKKDINPFIPVDSRFSAYFLQGILASKFISFLYLKLSSIATKDDFRQTTLAEIRKLPIPLVSLDLQIPIIDLVCQILTIKNSGPTVDTTPLEKKIDQLIYELYGLTDEEINIIESN